MQQSILVTGGAGYIGSHTCLTLLESGYDVIALDNLVNSSSQSLERVQELAGRGLTFCELDLLDQPRLRRVFEKERIDAVIHFAGLKAVGESLEKPLAYYENNVISTCNLSRVMQEFGVSDIVFSSSATVYGEPDSLPIGEEAPLRPANVYGRTKLINEHVLADLAQATPNWNVGLLRYFNPVGAHPSGRIGEDPSERPNNLMPSICQVAVGKLECLHVFGDDYPTPDGTGVRDYIHVMDLALGHVRTLEKLREDHGVRVYNLGTGRGYSVLELIRTFEEVSGKHIPYEIVPRRPGDVAACYADPSRADAELGWRAERGLRDMCRDAWAWQEKNPEGFRIS